MSTVQPSAYSLAILAAFQRQGRHIYGGTVPKHVVARRRAAAKVARRSRRVNRGRS